MAKWLLIVETNCTDATRETEFNEWYDKTHLPDILETQGFMKATRYENTKPSEGKGKFLAIYEIEANDIDQRHPIQEVSTGFPFFIVPLKNRKALEKSKLQEESFLEL